MNKNLLLGIFGNVVPEDKIIKYMSSEAVSGGWVDNNTDTSRNTFINGKGTLYLNDGVTAIGGNNSTDYSPFYSVSTVTSVDLKYSGLIYINSGAFQNCSSLTSVSIPDSVTSIGKSAFKGCSSLTSVSIPDSVTTIGKNVFKGCSSLVSITIPDSVTSIGSYAFSDCSGLTTITIPNSVTSIGSSAFEHCSGLTSITIPDSVISIGNNAFQYCNNLTSVTCLATNPPTLGANNFTAENDTLYVPEESVELYQNSETWNTAFTDIKKLPPVIEYQLTPGSIGLTGTWITNNTDVNKNTYDSSTGKGTLYLNDGVTAIGGSYSTDYSPFYSVSTVTSVDLKYSGLIYINSGAFQNCSSLTSVSIPDSVTTIGGAAFFGCSGLTSVIIGNSVTSIGNYAFSGCSSLTSINIPNLVTNIGEGAFHNCNSLTSITIPNSVTSIGGYTFENCSSLTLITIPDSVTSIGEWAFNACNSLISVTIPDSVTNIGGAAFNACNSLTTVTCLAVNPPTLGTSNFTASNDDTLYVPEESVETYKDTNWKDAFSSILPISQ